MWENLLCWPQFENLGSVAGILFFQADAVGKYPLRRLLFGFRLPVPRRPRELVNSVFHKPGVSHIMITAVSGWPSFFKVHKGPPNYGFCSRCYPHPAKELFLLADISDVGFIAASSSSTSVRVRKTMDDVTGLCYPGTLHETTTIAIFGGASHQSSLPASPLKTVLN